MQLWSV